jgi:SAM-dependent methyltransferase
MAQQTQRPIDEERLNELLAMAINEQGATYYAPLIVIGDRLGLYAALADAGPFTPAALAEYTDTAEPYIDQWLVAGAAGGYVTYDPETEQYSLTPEQTALLVDETSPAFVPGGFQGIVGVLRSLPEIEAAFRTGEGVGWHEHDEDVFHGTERLFKPGYLTNLVDEWIPALDGVESMLQEGARVADVGCGYGAATIIMAQAYPSSTFVGYDYHEESIETARSRAADAGVADRVRFEVATAQAYDGADYDLVTMFDCLHDMGDPVGAAAHVRETLAPDGTWLIVEPFANERVEDNFTPVGRVFYCASTMACTPNSLSQDVGYGLGAQAGETRLRDVATEGGFTHFRRAAETPFNLVLEAKR